MWRILTLKNVSLEKLDPADHNSAFVEGQSILAGWHFIGLPPCPEIAQWVSLVTSTLASGRRELAGGAWGPDFFLFAFKKLFWGILLWDSQNCCHREYSRCWLSPLYYHTSPQAAGVALLATFVLNRYIVIVYSCNSDHKFPSVKFPIVSNSSPARLVPQNSLVTSKKISVGEGLPAHWTAEGWSSIFSTSLSTGLDVWSRKHDFGPPGSLFLLFLFWSCMLVLVGATGAVCA